VIRFRVRGTLRFLSHAETLRVFQRACVRGRIGVRYSQGFNPRPKLSLPLPRPVGVESDDELLCIKVQKSREDADHLCSAVAAALSGQLPEDIELISASIARDGASYQPLSATYMLPLRRDCINEKLKATIEHLLASESLILQRRTGAGGSKIRNIDVRGFLTSIKVGEEGIIAECGISGAGSVRVDEVLSLLRLDQGMLAAPIRRTTVKWQ
jgi:radical SAM-linked protein